MAAAQKVRHAQARKQQQRDDSNRRRRRETRMPASPLAEPFANGWLSHVREHSILELAPQIFLKRRALW